MQSAGGIEFQQNRLNVIRSEDLSGADDIGALAGRMNALRARPKKEHWRFGVFVGVFHPHAAPLLAGWPRCAAAGIAEFHVRLSKHPLVRG